jgi:hypothetical protein
MNGIGDFLKKYLDFTPPPRAAARAVALAVGERFGITLAEEMVAVRGGRAYIDVPGALKSEIALNKGALLARVRELGGGKGISDLG